MRWVIAGLVVFAIGTGLVIYASTVLAINSWPPNGGHPVRWSACTDQLVTTSSTACLDSPAP